MAIERWSGSGQLRPDLHIRMPGGEAADESALIHQGRRLHDAEAERAAHAAAHAATASLAASTARSTRRASASNAGPASVSSTRRVVRVNRVASSSRSSAWTDTDTADCSAFARACTVLPDRQLATVIILVGHYLTVARLTGILEIELDPRPDPWTSEH